MSHDHIRKFLSLAACLALLALAAGCSDDSTSPGGGGGDDDPVSEDIGAGGGQITSADGDFTVDIPAGALNETTTLTLTRLTGDDVPAELAAEGVTTAYEIGPEGVDFQQPATITYDAPLPAKEDRILDVRLVLLMLAMSGVGSVELIDNQELLFDGDADTEQITFVVDRTIMIGILELEGVYARLKEVPLSVDCGDPFGIKANVGKSGHSAFAGSVTYQDRSSLIANNPITFNGDMVSLGVLDEQTHDLDIPVSSYTCHCAEDVVGTIAAALIFTNYRVSATLASTGTFTIHIRGLVSCIAPEPSATSQVGIAANPMPGAEGLFRIRPGFAGLLVLTFLIVVAGLNSWGIINPILGLAVLTLFMSPGLQRFGAVPLSWLSPMKQGEYVDAVFSFGPIGASLTHYYPDPGEWGWTQLMGIQNNITDGVPFGNASISEGLVWVNNSFNQVHFIEFNPGTEAFEGTGESLTWEEFPDISGGLVSAYAASADGPVLVVSDGSPGNLYVHPRDGRKMATLVGAVGDGPRRVRHAGNIAVVSNFLGGSLTIAVWDGVAATATITETVSVGDGPIGIDVMDLGDGTVGVCSTAFTDNTYTVTVVDGSGNVVSNVTTPVPGDCTGPGHAIWARDGTRNILFTCNGSDHIVTVHSGL